MRPACSGCARSSRYPSDNDAQHQATARWGRNQASRRPEIHGSSATSTGSFLLLLLLLQRLPGCWGINRPLPCSAVSLIKVRWFRLVRRSRCRCRCDVKSWVGCRFHRNLHPHLHPFSPTMYNLHTAYTTIFSCIPTSTTIFTSTPARTLLHLHLKCYFNSRLHHHLYLTLSPTPLSSPPHTNHRHHKRHLHAGSEECGVSSGCVGCKMVMGKWR